MSIEKKRTYDAEKELRKSEAFVRSLVASAEASSEPQAQSARCALATCPPADFDAEAFLTWLGGMVEKNHQWSDGAARYADYIGAEKFRNYAAAFATAQTKLRRLVGDAAERQPQQNGADQPRRGANQ